MHSRILTYQSGFSLIEVLVALVLLSVGLLGIAALQVSGIRFAHNANIRYQAMLQAIDMSDRMRANQSALQSGAYSNISGLGTNPNCISTNCSPTQMAQADQYEWNTANARLLPNGTGTVTQNGSLYTITVRWQEMEGRGSAASTQQIQLTVEP